VSPSPVRWAASTRLGRLHATWVPIKSTAKISLSRLQDGRSAAFVWRDGRRTRAQQTETDVLFGGAVTTATGSCACSRRTPSWGTQISAAEAPLPGPGRLGAALAQPQLNHAGHHRGYAALRPGRGANAPTWPDAGSLPVLQTAAAVSQTAPWANGQDRSVPCLTWGFDGGRCWVRTNVG
jgi:hypothetical protein